MTEYSIKDYAYAVLVAFFNKFLEILVTSIAIIKLLIVTGSILGVAVCFEYGIEL